MAHTTVTLRKVPLPCHGCFYDCGTALLSDRSVMVVGMNEREIEHGDTHRHPCAIISLCTEGDTLTLQATPSPSPVNPLVYGCIVARVGPHVYAFGGFDDWSDVFVSELHRYTVDTDTWETVGGLDAKEVKARINSGDSLEYSLHGNTWPVPRGGWEYECVGVGGLFMVSGGTDNDGAILHDTWVYDPSTAVWTEVDTGGTVSCPDEDQQYTLIGECECFGHIYRTFHLYEYCKAATSAAEPVEQGYVGVWTTTPTPISVTSAVVLTLPRTRILLDGKGTYHCLDTVSGEWSPGAAPVLEGAVSSRAFSEGSVCMFGGEWSMYGVCHTAAGTMLVTVSQEEDIV
ncbi:hypothetical protein KIPB_000016 [Kipferlia bialata]|uniref:Uncharacterized protein n=1 Tax=Kipferlia bialata TaxID=797122 RepID=A0A9K3CNB9_9EUKA|nr:hypothetical protein KIPB_000016 [Kipferlia bialata]|eukprot:g16.t1